MKWPNSKVEVGGLLRSAGSNPRVKVMWPVVLAWAIVVLLMMVLRVLPGIISPVNWTKLGSKVSSTLAKAIWFREGLIMMIKEEFGGRLAEAGVA